MTQEEKQLLFKDLCARLPYGVKAEVMGWDEEKGEEVFVPVTVYSVNTDGYVYFADNDYDITYCSIDACRLYLRPMSSMTEEEKIEWLSLKRNVNKHFWIDELLDFYLSHHLDFSGLLLLGLARKALPGMYKTE